MLYLILSIFGAAFLNIAMTIVNHKKLAVLKVLWVNYLVAVAGSAAMLMKASPTFLSPNLPSFVGNLTGSLTPSGSVASAMIFGVFTGAVFLTDLLMIRKCTELNGPSPTTMFGKLGVLIPVVFAIVLWKEMPAAIQWSGIVLAIVSLVVFNFDGKIHFNGFLLIVLVTGGVATMASKLCAAYVLPEYSPFFTLCAYLTAAILSGIMLLGRRKKTPFRIQEILLGVVTGIANVSFTLLLIKSLSIIPASIAYPVFSTGAIMVVVIVGRLFFAERLGKQHVAAIILTIISLVLINL